VSGHQGKAGELLELAPDTEISALSGAYASTLPAPLPVVPSLLCRETPVSIAIESSEELEQLRARLRKMSDEELVRFGKAARSLCRARYPETSPPPAKDVRLVVGNNYGFACKDIGIDIGWDRLSLENTCPEIVLRPAIPFGPDSRTMISSSLKWNDV